MSAPTPRQAADRVEAVLRHADLTATEVEALQVLRDLGRASHSTASSPDGWTPDERDPHERFSVTDPWDHPGWPLAKRIVATVRDGDPDEIDSTDGDYEAVLGLLDDAQWRRDLHAADAMGLVGDWGTDDVTEAVTEAMHRYRQDHALATDPAAGGDLAALRDELRAAYLAGHHGRDYDHDGRAREVLAAPASEGGDDDAELPLVGIAFDAMERSARYAGRTPRHTYVDVVAAVSAVLDAQQNPTPREQGAAEGDDDPPDLIDGLGNRWWPSAIRDGRRYYMAWNRDTYDIASAFHRHQLVQPVREVVREETGGPDGSQV